ncbi:small-subunit processome [Cantharellus anzutake]|uniref:small-subunit processome n=1 Tax=Cantharellus anzutake TaxID=1750568 RepID=UPI0019032314|nr:small-subunit processome [Cantharellus anzutake]KAF8338029.1 small-subunit processome [Cantharellus anzutake]
MPGSSLRNAIQRRSHKERSQPAHRAKLGLLEKKKDYILRARDYHQKQEALKLLQEKAATRNKDEFYFAMTRQRTEGGIHVSERPQEDIPEDMAKLLKTQDVNYIRTMKALNLKRIEAVKADLTTMINLLYSGSAHLDDELNKDTTEDLTEVQIKTLRDAGLLPPETSDPNQSSDSGFIPSRKHIIFVDSPQHAKLYEPPIAVKPQTSSVPEGIEMSEEDFGWVKEGGLKRKKRRKNNTGDLGNGEVSEEQLESQRREGKLYRDKLLHELKERLTRERALRYALQELHTQRLLMGKGERQLVSGSEKEDDEIDKIGLGIEVEDRNEWKPKIYKWKFERKN